MNDLYPILTEIIYFGEIGENLKFKNNSWVKLFIFRKS